jgi:IgGFc binding protein
MLSVTISTDKTVIWYDHWEDGFDIDVTSDVLPVAKSTEIWGDGNAANGCAPHIRNNCTNMNDILNAGTSIVVQNDVPLPRNPAAHVVYDGGDRIQASFPVAVTRASFPKSPGSVFAGAVEMYDTTMWGQIYEAPVGAGTYLTNNTDPFEISGFSCLAAEDNTRVTMPNGTVSTLRMGQSIFVPVRMSNQVRADKPIQVVLLTLDKDSLVQTRWYTMRPVSSFQRSYVSPVGDSVANTAIIVYNAGTCVKYAECLLQNAARSARDHVYSLSHVVAQHTRLYRPQHHDVHRDDIGE